MAFDGIKIAISQYYFWRKSGFGEPRKCCKARLIQPLGLVADFPEDNGSQWSDEAGNITGHVRSPVSKSAARAT